MTRYNTDFLNPALPPAGSLSSRIAAMTGLRSWWRVGADNTLVSGAVSQINPLAGASAAVLAQGNADRRPIYTDGAFGVYPGADFDGSNDVLLASELPYTKTGTFSYAALVELDDIDVAQDIMCLFSSVGASTNLRLKENGYPEFQHGSGTVTIPQDMRARKLLLIASSNGTQIKLRANGVDATPTATNNSQTASTLTIGAASSLGLQAASMRGGDFWIWQTDILSDQNSRNLVQAYGVRNGQVVLA